jgi:class 3 adenylate cyclase
LWEVDLTLKTDLEDIVRDYFQYQWTTRNGQVVPNDTSVTLGNDGINLDATILYADLADSTDLVQDYIPEFAAEIYKAYLTCAARVIRSEGGTITAYDGDRIMAVYLGDAKNTAAVRTAMRIYWAVWNIIRPLKSAQYPTNTYTLKSHVGIDTSSVMVAKTGVRGANDLVWVGRAANYAAKMASFEEFATYISSDVYNKLADSAKYSNGIDMWSARTWTARGGITVYGSNYHWSIP